jgi:hypothetical protein
VREACRRWLRLVAILLLLSQPELFATARADTRPVASGRMRAYPSHRFNDRAAIYYAVELRVIPDWNPFHAWPAFQDYAAVEWLQFVPFVELGRLAPEWELGELHSDMK